MKSIITLLVSILLPCCVFATELKPFTTDGCSVFPDGTGDQQSLWLKCCIKHDFDYWKGGTFQERMLSDKKLESCVTGVGEKNIAKIMLIGVRIGGSPFIPAPYRWGYGWPYPRGYQTLTKIENRLVKEKLQQTCLLIVLALNAY